VRREVSRSPRQCRAHQRDGPPRSSLRHRYILLRTFLVQVHAEQSQRNRSFQKERRADLAGRRSLPSGRTRCQRLRPWRGATRINKDEATTARSFRHCLSSRFPRCYSSNCPSVRLTFVASPATHPASRSRRGATAAGEYDVYTPSRLRPACRRDARRIP